MFDRRALPGTIAGFLGLAFAIAAVITQEPVLVMVAGVLTAVCVVLVLMLPDRAPVRYKERRDLQEEAEKLSRENDQMAARAAKFEAEAIAAREKLATAMLAERSGVLNADTAPAAPAPTPVERSGDDITDPDTGVFTQVFFDASLGKRISAARRGLRPLTVAMVEVVEKVGPLPPPLKPPVWPAPLPPTVTRSVSPGVTANEPVTRAPRPPTETPFVSPLAPHSSKWTEVTPVGTTNGSEVAVSPNVTVVGAADAGVPVPARELTAVANSTADPARSKVRLMGEEPFRRADTDHSGPRGARSAGRGEGCQSPSTLRPGPGTGTPVPGGGLRMHVRSTHSKTLRHRSADSRAGTEAHTERVGVFQGRCGESDESSVCNSP